MSDQSEPEKVVGCATCGKIVDENGECGCSEPQTNKNAGQKPHARVKPGTQVSQYVAKVFKKAAQIADLMTGEDVAADLKVLRDARKATHQVYDTKTKKLKRVPDHKTRLAATTLSRAYHEGKPVERSVSAKGDFKDFPELVDRLNDSQAYREALGSLQKTVDCKEVTPALPPHDN
jgi:hypothetical protein